MAEIGSGNGSSYPSALDTDSTTESTSTVARSDVPNDLAAAIVAVQGELGTDPAGSTANVKTYLQVEHDTDGTHTAITVSGTATVEKPKRKPRTTKTRTTKTTPKDK